MSFQLLLANNLPKRGAPGYEWTLSRGRSERNGKVGRQLEKESLVSLSLSLHYCLSPYRVTPTASVNKKPSSEE